MCGGRWDASSAFMERERMSEDEPLGGMDAKRAAVAAVEERSAREERSRLRQERRAAFRSCLAWLIVLSVVVASAAYLVCRHYGIDCAEIGRTLREAINGRRYARVVEPFRISPIADWSTAPEFLRPGKVETNTVYHAMLPGDDGCVLLELTAVPGAPGFKVRRLSSIAEPMEMPPETFKALVDRNPYLISVNGSVYFCGGKKSAAAKEAFRKSLFSPRPVKRQRK